MQNQAHESAEPARREATDRAARYERRRPLPIATTLAGLVVVAVVAATAAGSGRPSDAVARVKPAAGWVTFRDRLRGLTVHHPRSWTRAGATLLPFLADPRQILALGTYTLRSNGPDVCAQNPVRAVEDLGPTDALIVIEERHHDPGSVRDTRPTHFRLRDGQTSELPDCLPAGAPQRHAFEGWFSFTDAGRSLYALVVLGRMASARTRTDAVVILDSLRFTPTPRPRSVDNAPPQPAGWQLLASLGSAVDIRGG